jgi:hypothetical protein
MSEEYVITETPFSIDVIDIYLLNTKNMLIKMNILLDTHEINKCLANSLNRALLKNDVVIENIYNNMHSKWEEITASIPIIEEKIRSFNKSQKYEYYVDFEDVFYLVFYKQIEYVKKILMETILYLNSNVNLIFIYTFIIQSFYDEPNIFSNNYIFILSKLVNSVEYNNLETIKDFFSEIKIKKLGYVLNLIYTADIKFSELIEKINNDKIAFIKEDIHVPIDKNYNNYNCLNKGVDKVVEEQERDSDSSFRMESFGKSSSKELKKLDTGFDSARATSKTRDIEVIETEFRKLKCDMLFDRREINIGKIYDGLPHLLTDGGLVIRELWLGVMLFLYKKYTFNFDEFNKQVSQLLKSNNYGQDFIPSTDTFKDLDLPDSIYVSNQVGGNKNVYFTKYLKYKTKYLNLLRKIK